MNSSQVGRLYIIEGPDGAGKSTFAQRLAYRWGRAGFAPRIAHASHKPTLEEQYAGAVKLLSEGAWPVIMDRSPFSESVYGPVMRDEILGSSQDWELWYKFCAKFDAVKIRLDAPNPVLIERAFGRDQGEHFVDEEELVKIAEKYRAEARHWTDWWHLGPSLQTHFLDTAVGNHIRSAKNALNAAART